MRDIEDFRYELAFVSVQSAIENRITEFHPDFPFRVDDAKDVLRQVVRGLGTIANRGSEGYEPIKHFHEVRNVFLQGEGAISEMQIVEEASAKFKAYLSLLDRLRKEPERVYENEHGSRMLIEMCDKMADIYSGPLSERARELLDS